MKPMHFTVLQVNALTVLGQKIFLDNLSYKSFNLGKDGKLHLSLMGIGRIQIVW